jgi:UDP-GlcNAc:undecaprenyl-phosphate GlcNAc-1-phosphate transferase
MNIFDAYPDWWQVGSAVAAGSLVLTWLTWKLTGTSGQGIRNRDVHTQPKSRFGGVAMWLAVIVSLLLLLGTQSERLQVGSADMLTRLSVGLGLAMLVVLITGLLDDIRGLKPSTQVAGQALAGLCVALGGVQVPYLRLPFIGNLDLTVGGSMLPDALGGGVFWPLSVLLTVLWVVALINALNLFDGLDGLAASVTVTAGIVLFLISLRLGFLGASTLSLVTAAAALGFLVLNWHPSKLFMGSVGSQLLGLLLATAALVSGAKLATAVLVLGIPVLDAVVVVIRRLRAGVSPFVGDQRHLHHRLLHLGMPVRMVVVSITALSVLFGTAALLIEGSEAKALLTLALVASMLLVLLITILLERRVGRGVH